MSKDRLEDLKKKFPQHQWVKEPLSLIYCSRCGMVELTPVGACVPLLRKEKKDKK